MMRDTLQAQKEERKSSKPVDQEEAKNSDDEQRFEDMMVKKTLEYQNRKI